MARVLGWASLALAVPQLVTPKKVLRLAGVHPGTASASLVRLVGVRELGAAAGLLSKPKQGAWLWARVAGDAMDLALLGRALRGAGTSPRRLTPATAAVVGITALDIVAGLQRNRAAKAEGATATTRARSAVTVNRPRAEVYKFWRQFENLPQFMHHLEAVDEHADGRSHWKAKAPFGRTVEWDAEIVEDIPEQHIAWRALPGSDVDNRGVVGFRDAPGGRGTEVLVELAFEPPGGPLGAVAAKLFGEHPDQQIADDLRRFKQIMETGEIVVSDASRDGTKTLNQVRQRDAQPGEAR